MSIDPGPPEHETPKLDAPSKVVSGSSWQIFPNDLLAFERILAPDGPSRLLLSSLEFCSRPECTCRQVTLKAIDLDLTALPDNYAEFQQLLDQSEIRYFQIDIDLGLVDRIQRPDPRPPLDEHWLAFLRSQVDGQLLDRLHERWTRAKGIKDPGGWRTIDWSRRHLHELVAWEEMFPEDRVDHFLLNGRVFFASENYCRKPDCSCGEVRIAFTEIGPAGKYRDIGSLRIALPDGTLRERVASRRHVKTIDALWAAFQARHPVGTHLGERNRRIQLIAPSLARTSATQPSLPSLPRTGRNDPCPCGSGKKFKRCCAP